MINIIRHIKQFFDAPDIEELAAYQHKLPRSVTVDTSYDKKTGYYTAKITHFEDKAAKGLIITESKTPAGLVAMVNDAILTYLDIPERIRVRMPQLLPEDIDFAERPAETGGDSLRKLRVCAAGEDGEVVVHGGGSGQRVFSSGIYASAGLDATRKGHRRPRDARRVR